MSYKIKDVNLEEQGRNPHYGWHKGRPFIYFIVPEPLMYVDDVHIFCIGFSETEWYIVPATEENEKFFDDIGPFDSPDDAFLHIKLVNDRMEDE